MKSQSVILLLIALGFGALIQLGITAFGSTFGQFGGNGANAPAIACLVLDAPAFFISELFEKTFGLSGKADGTLILLFGIIQWSLILWGMLVWAHRTPSK